MTDLTSVYLWLAGLVFQAGVFYAGIRYLRRDVDGLGKKQRADQLRGDKRFRAIVALLIVALPPEHLKQAVDLLVNTEP